MNAHFRQLVEVPNKKLFVRRGRSPILYILASLWLKYCLSINMYCMMADPRPTMIIMWCSILDNNNTHKDYKTTDNKNNQIETCTSTSHKTQ